MFRPFANAGYKKFVEATKASKYEYHVVVRDPLTGRILSQGDHQMAFEHLTKARAAERRTSGDWVPDQELVKLPKPLVEMVGETAALRRYTSQLITSLLGPKQRLGQVRKSFFLNYFILSSIFGLGGFAWVTRGGNAMIS